MRRLSVLTILMTMLPLLLSGCHQAPSTTGAPPMSPAGIGAAPSLNPFGGTTTRVSPPPTGSYSTPNTYMGSPVPAGTVAPGQVSPMPPGPYPTQSNNAVGSGVQPGGWTTSDPLAAQPAPNSSGVATVSTFGVATANDPRAGGMQVHDLTNAPAPPGYRPDDAGINVSVPPPQSPAAYGAPASPTQVYPTPTFPTSTISSSTYPTNSSAEIASRLTPISPSTNAVPMNPGSMQSFGAPVQSSPVQGSIPGPSTEPVNATTVQGDTNLMWRAPGTQF